MSTKYEMEVIKLIVDKINETLKTKFDIYNKFLRKINEIYDRLREASIDFKLKHNWQIFIDNEQNLRDPKLIEYILENTRNQLETIIRNGLIKQTSVEDFQKSKIIHNTDSSNIRSNENMNYIKTIKKKYSEIESEQIKNLRMIYMKEISEILPPQFIMKENMKKSYFIPFLSKKEETMKLKSENLMDENLILSINEINLLIYELKIKRRLSGKGFFNEPINLFLSEFSSFMELLCKKEINLSVLRDIMLKRSNYVERIKQKRVFKASNFLEIEQFLDNGEKLFLKAHLLLNKSIIMNNSLQWKKHFELSNKLTKYMLHFFNILENEKPKKLDVLEEILETKEENQFLFN
eukprot:TRINITY_DN10170_c0_g1_i1.p1 TRINITY_DN10170_c0_g1~~TRINITY_DN10170_c0_g1_i1.p1  ORF type:complete len:350 (-),score=67.38 TRINITY_DN10170_c0_g1_i1:786-1835(-)